MESSITAKPLIDTSTGLFCHLVELGTTKIVIDCGIGPDFDYSIYDSAKETIMSADCILLTSFSTSHMGAAGLFKDVPIFCTIPTAVLGKILLDEMYAHIGEKVLNSFEPKQVKYSQPFPVKDIEIVPYNAGFTIGNCIFKIKKNFETISIGYNFNHRKENFLEGLDYRSIENTKILITNTEYASIPSYTLKQRDEAINSVVRSSSSRVIFLVSYCRLLELLCVLHRHKISIVAKYGKMFVDRIKAMIEWINVKASETIHQLDVEFIKVGELNDKRIVIVISEAYRDGYAGTVIDALNNENNSLVIIDRYSTGINFQEMKVFTYSYRKKEIKSKIENKSVRNFEDDENENDHWCKHGKVFFVNDGLLEYKDFYPRIKRRRQNNEYGEHVDFRFECQVEENDLKLPKVQETEEIEEKALMKVGIDPRIQVIDLEMFGMCDFSSFRTMCESSACNSIVFTDQDKVTSRFMSNYFKTCRLGALSFVVDKSIKLGSFLTVSQLSVTSKVTDQRFKKLADKSIAHFKARRTQETLDCVGECNPIILSSLELDVFRKSLIEEGLRVELDNDKLIVNDQIEILFERDILTINGNSCDILIAIRNIMHRYTAIV